MFQLAKTVYVCVCVRVFLPVRMTDYVHSNNGDELGESRKTPRDDNESLEQSIDGIVCGTRRTF